MKFRGFFWFVLFLLQVDFLYAQNVAALVPFISGDSFAVLQGEQVQVIDPQTSLQSIGQVAMSPDGQYAYLVEATSVGNRLDIIKISLNNFQVVDGVFFSTTSSRRVCELEISPKGGTLAVGFEQRGEVAIIKTNENGRMAYRGTIQTCESCNGTTNPLLSPVQLSFWGERTVHVTNPEENELLSIRVDTTPPSIVKTHCCPVKFFKS